eukprot:COSAG01_NODE_49_length_31891_cov_29.945773_11_plen_75_part_00
MPLLLLLTANHRHDRWQKTPYVSFPQTTNGMRSGNEDDGYIRHDNIDCSVGYDNYIIIIIIILLYYVRYISAEH